MTIRTLVLAMLVATPAYSMGYFPHLGHSHILAEGSAQITSPKDLAVIEGEAKNVLVYDFHPSPKGNHLAIYVDDDKPVDVHEWRGDYRLPLLGRGEHHLCVREANASRVLTGLQKCITVTAK